MQAHKVLAEDWTEYDNRKKRQGDAAFFACSEPWEVEFLIIQLVKHYPGHTRAQFIAAIQACCALGPGNHPRKALVECVTAQLQ